MATTPTPIPIKNDPEYVSTRNAVLLRVESFHPRIYFDTVGIPTISVGVNLIPKGSNGKVAIAEDRIAIIELELGKKLPEFREQLKQVVDIVNSTPTPVGAINLNKFFETERGKALGDILDISVKRTPSGEAVVFEVDDWADLGINLTPAQSNKLVNSIVGQYEDRLDRTLIKNGIDPANLDSEQRASLLAMVWHGKPGQTIAIAREMVKDEPSEEVIRSLFKEAAGENTSFQNRHALLANVANGDLMLQALLGICHQARTHLLSYSALFRTTFVDMK